MKKVKISTVEKRLIRSIFVFSLVQILILCFSIRLFSGAQPIDIHDAKQTDIVVEDIYCVRLLRDKWLFIIADSEKYIYENQTTFDEYSIYDLNESIHVGDKLSLVYRKKYANFGKVNAIIAMQSETKTYRTVEEYNSRQQGVPAFVVVIFSIIELVFVGVVFIYVWLNYRTFKDVYKKLKSTKSNL